MSGADEIERVRRTARERYTAGQVQEALDRMATRITADLAQKRPLVVAVMHGGVFTAVHLCARFSFAHEFDYLHVTRYAGDTRGGSLNWLVRPSRALAGRTVLLVDDILDHGKTLRAIDAELERSGVAKQLTAVLVVKRLALERPSVTVSGLAVDDVYVFGSGMDYRGYWRGLAGIYAVREGT